MATHRSKMTVLVVALAIAAAPMAAAWRPRLLLQEASAPANEAPAEATNGAAASPAEGSAPAAPTMEQEPQALAVMPVSSLEPGAAELVLDQQDMGSEGGAPVTELVVPAARPVAAPALLLSVAPEAEELPARAVGATTALEVAAPVVPAEAPVPEAEPPTEEIEELIMDDSALLVLPVTAPLQQVPAEPAADAPAPEPEAPAQVKVTAVPAVAVAPPALVLAAPQPEQAPPANMTVGRETVTPAATGVFLPAVANATAPGAGGVAVAPVAELPAAGPAAEGVFLPAAAAALPQSIVLPSEAPANDTSAAGAAAQVPTPAQPPAAPAQPPPQILGTAATPVPVPPLQPGLANATAQAIDVSFAPELAADVAPEPAAAGPGALQCTDTAVPGSNLTCDQQAQLGKCNADWMLEGNFCAASCGRPPCPDASLPLPVAQSEECTDVPPDDRFTCQQQKEFGKCTAVWMLQGGYCARTCGLPPCPALA